MGLVGLLRAYAIYTWIESSDQHQIKVEFDSKPNEDSVERNQGEQVKWVSNLNSTREGLELKSKQGP